MDKRKIDGKTQIVKAEALEIDTLMNVSIYKFDENDVLIERIMAKKSNISNSKWIAKNVVKYKFGSDRTIENFETLLVNSNYDKEKLNSIYSNLDTISFYKLIRNADNLYKKVIILCS